MSKRIYLTESQFNAIMEQQMLNESFGSILEKVAAGILGVYVACAMVRGCKSLPEIQKQKMIQQIEAVAPQNNNLKDEDIAAQAISMPNDTLKKTKKSDWVCITNDAVVTVYNAVPSQCNNDVQHTASMFRLDLEKPESHRIVALERTFMQKHGIEFGDLIMIKGTHMGRQDGVFQVQDLMNKRFAGMDKVDVLVDHNTKYGGTSKNETAQIFILKKGVDDAKYRQGMAPQAPKQNKN